MTPTPWRRRARGVAAALALTALTPACGKKGMPIPPPLRIPAPVETLAAVRFGNEVYVTVTVPAANIDASIPVDIGRIEIYGYTGRLAPPRARWAELGTRLATIAVPQVPLDYRAPTPQAAAVLPPSAMPGTPVTVRDTLTPDEFEQGPVYVDPRRQDPAIPLPAVPAMTSESRAAGGTSMVWGCTKYWKNGRPGYAMMLRATRWAGMAFTRCIRTKSSPMSVVLESGRK